MKKILAFFLIGIMGLTSVSFAEDSVTSDEATADAVAVVSQFTKELGLLTELGVIDYGEDVAEDTITKGEFLKYTLRFVGLSEAVDAENKRQVFVDVPLTSEYSGAVYVAYQTGILKGNPNGSCGINSKISLDEAITLMIRSLRMEVIAEDAGGYPIGYRTVAIKENILKDIDDLLMEKVTYDITTKLLYNSLFLPVTKVVGYNEDVSIVGFDKKASIIEGIHKVKYIDGIVESNDRGSIYGKTEESAGKVIINGEYFNAGDNFADKYLGMKVRAFFKTPKGQTISDIIYMDEMDNSVIEVAREDIISYRAREFIYNDENDKTVTKRVSESAITISEGEMKTIGNSVYHFPAECVVRLIDNNDDRIIDIVFIDAYHLICVSRVDADKEIVYNALSSDSNFKGEEYARIIIEDTEGNRLGFSDITQDDVIEAYLEKGKSLAYLKVVKDRLSMVVKSLKTKTENGYTVYLLTDDDRETYRTSYSFATNSPNAVLQAEGNYNFAVDSMGRIIAVLSERMKDGMMYAYVRGFAEESTGFRTIVKISLYTENGEFVITESDNEVYCVADKTKISNGELKNRLKTAGLIRVKMDEDGTLEMIDFPSSDKKINGFKKVGLSDVGTSKGGNRWYQTGMVMGGKVFASSSTKVMLVPAGDKLLSNEDLFSIEAISYFKNDNYYPNVAGYCNGEGYAADIMIVQEPKADTLNAPAMLVTYIGTTYDSKAGENRTAIGGYVKGEIKEYILSDGQSLSDKTLVDKGIDGDIEIGDAIRINVNIRGEVNYIKKMYDESAGMVYGKNPTSGDTSPDTDYGNGGYHVFGAITEKFENSFKIDRGVGKGDPDDIFPVNSTTYIYEYDKNHRGNNAVRLLSVDDLVSRDDAGAGADNVFIYMYKPPIEMIVVYR